MQTENTQDRCYRIIIEIPCRDNNYLTERELEVAALMLAGLTGAQMAERLNISYPTVSNHIANIRRKTGTVGETRQAMLNTIRG